MPFPQKHGRGTTWGLRIGPFAYSTDTDGLDEQAFAMPAAGSTSGSSMRCATARTRATPISSWRWAGSTVSGRPQAYLTHMNHEVDYADWAPRLPERRAAGA